MYSSFKAHEHWQIYFAKMPATATQQCFYFASATVGDMIQVGLVLFV
jgi:hypothetical protein